MRIKNIGYLIDSINGRAFSIGKTCIRNGSKTVRFGKRTFVIDMNFPAMTLERKRVYVFDLKGGQLCFEGNPSSLMDPETLDIMISESIVRDLAYSQKKKLDVIDLILKIGMGFGIGLSVGLIVSEVI